jgi:hypothetical protein
MLRDLWMVIRGKASVVPKAVRFEPILPKDDEANLLEAPEPPIAAGQPVTGFACIISYRDAKGRESLRRITCQRLDLFGNAKHKYAYCHERAAVRQFNLSRVGSVSDILTGEAIGDGAAFFDRFSVDRQQQSPVGWGLSVSQRADLLAGLNALVFMARCDKHWHPAERETIESFVSSYWIRADIRGDAPIDDIMAHTDRLAPDAEAFFMSLTRCQESRLLAKTIRRSIQTVVDADGLIRTEEVFWGAKVDEFFRSL